MTDKLDTLFADLLASQDTASASLPPVHLWKPKLSGDMDMIIDREGRWIHEGGEIKRPAMVKLFASILVLEEGDYFLVTPVEKWRIQVEVAPLFVISAERETRDGYQAVKLTTHTGDVVIRPPTSSGDASLSLLRRPAAAGTSAAQSAGATKPQCVLRDR